MPERRASRAPRRESLQMLLALPIPIEGFSGLWGIGAGNGDRETKSPAISHADLLIFVSLTLLKASFKSAA